MYFSKFATLLSVLAVVGSTAAFNVDRASHCADVCTSPPPSCKDEPALCCCIPDAPSTKTCTSYIGKPTGVCAFVCTNPPPKCSEQPGLCCCEPDVITTTCAPQHTKA